MPAKSKTPKKRAPRKPAEPRDDGVPASFQLAGHTIRVVTVPKSRWKYKNAVALWMPNECRIELHGALHGTARQQAFMHEATHALLDVAGYSNTLSMDEELVDRLAHLLMQMIQTFSNE
jgi:hypothetical protein